MIPPFDILEGREFEVVAVAPCRMWPDHLSFVEAVDCFSQGIVV